MVAVDWTMAPKLFFWFLFSFKSFIGTLDLCSYNYSNAKTWHKVNISTKTTLVNNGNTWRFQNLTVIHCSLWIYYYTLLLKEQVDFLPCDIATWKGYVILYAVSDIQTMYILVRYGISMGITTHFCELVTLYEDRTDI